jgi:hypothetical protein
VITDKVFIGKVFGEMSSPDRLRSTTGWSTILTI